MDTEDDMKTEAAILFQFFKKALFFQIDGFAIAVFSRRALSIWAGVCERKNQIGSNLFRSEKLEVQVGDA